MVTQNFSYVPRSWQDEENIFLYFFTGLKTYHLSYCNIFGILLQLNHQYNLLSVV